MIFPVESTVKEGPNAESCPMIESTDFRGALAGGADTAGVGRATVDSVTDPGAAPTPSADAPAGDNEGAAVVSAAFP